MTLLSHSYCTTGTSKPADFSESYLLFKVCYADTRQPSANLIIRGELDMDGGIKVVEEIAIALKNLIFVLILC